MDQEIKKKWVEALRSGRYTQGRHFLMSPTASGQELCCLGVLCDVVDPDGWLSRGPVSYIPTHGLAAISPGYDKPLPISLLDPKHQKILTGMNDGGSSFADIADYIEKNL